MSVSWSTWLRRWDEQQESFNPDRERRFSAMLDVVAATQSGRFRALDLGAGPGALSVRLLERFPRARVVAVDYDPVVLAVGRGALGSYGGRLRWADAQLGSPGWTAALPPGRFDAALSTTALHWLRPPALRALYRDLARLLRPGGVFLNGDVLPWGPNEPEFARVAARVRRVRSGQSDSRAGWEAWRRWWKDAERDPRLGPLFRERQRRQSQHPAHGDTPLDTHVRALRRAGFQAVQVVWQDQQNRVLCGIR